MSNANSKDAEGVAAVISAAQAGVMKERLTELVEGDFPAVAALLDLLIEHPAVEGNDTLTGAVSAVRTLFVRLWDNVEAIA